MQTVQVAALGPDSPVNTNRPEEVLPIFPPKALAITCAGHPHLLPKLYQKVVHLQIPVDSIPSGPPGW